MDDRLRRAKKYLAIAESKDSKREAYKAAATEIAAYRDASPRRWRAEAASYCNTSTATIDKLVQWKAGGFKADTPFLADPLATTRAATSHTKKLLREAPLEQVEQIIAGLPKERQQAIAAAAGDRYAKARQDYDEQERSLSPADRKARDATAGAVERTARSAAAGFTVLGIVGHLEQASEELRELAADGSLPRKLVTQIDRALAAFVTEFEVAKGMAGLESGRADL